MKLVEYKASNVVGYNGKKVIVDDEFVPKMDKLNAVCKAHGFLCVVTNSKREGTNVKGAIVPPAQMSNHIVGHAIDCNLQDLKTKEWYNSAKMGDGRGEDECVIRAIETAGIRWGGEFRKKDEVHFDDSLNLNDPDKWHELNKKLNG